jgi:hypothetical protein
LGQKTGENQQLAGLAEFTLIYISLSCCPISGREEEFNPKTGLFSLGVDAVFIHIYCFWTKNTYLLGYQCTVQKTA